MNCAPIYDIVGAWRIGSFPLSGAFAIVSVGNALTRDILKALPSKPLRRGSDFDPDIAIYSIDGEEIVVKDFARKDWMTRNLYGRFSIRREAKALERLAGVRGVPQYRGRPDAFSVAMTYVPSSPVSAIIGASKDNEPFVRELEEIVAAMHQRGVLHLDMKHRTNIVVTKDGHPVVLDFTGSIRVNPHRFGGRSATWLLGAGDRMALRKWKRRLCPQTLSPREMRRAQFERKLRRMWLPRIVTDAFVAILPKPPKRKQRG